MSGDGSRIPKISQQRPSVDFIDTKLSHSIPAFNHPGVEYDPSSKEYVPITDADTMTTSPTQIIPPRTTLPEVEAMKFWGCVFSESMEKLKGDFNEPTWKNYSQHNIRAEKDWDGVRLQLVNAKEKYSPSKDGANSKKTKFQRFLKGAYRKVANSSENLKILTQIGDQVDYISPVLSVVDILLDAASTASKVRKQVKTEFDPSKIEENFGDIEFFIATFPRDEVIQGASIDLVAYIFKGIEDAIGFFLSAWYKRAGSAILKGADYQEDLLQCIDDIQKYSGKLLKEAQKSDMYYSRAGNEITIKNTEGILKIVSSNSKKIDEALKAAKEQARMLNYAMKLFDEADEKEKRLQEERRELEKRELKMEERERRQERREKRREKREKERKERDRKTLEALGNIQDELRKANTPSPFLYQNVPALPFSQPLLLPPSSIQAPVPWYPPAVQNQQPQWLPISLQWPNASYTRPLTPPQQQPPVQQHFLSNAEILDALYTPEFEKKDFKYILDLRYQMNIKSRRCAEAALASREFRKWLTKSKSAKLLIQGDESYDGEEISGVSLLSATIFQALLSRERYLRLAFFCRLHIDKDDGYVGGKAMAKSFVAQLLRQHTFDLSPLNERGVTLEQIRKGKLKELCKLLLWLIHQLPEDVKVVCIIDEAGKYENDDLEDKMLTVLKTLLSLTKKRGSRHIVKVMVTSSEATDKVCDLFEDDEDSQLDLDTFDEGQDLEEYGSGSKLIRDDDSDSSSSSELDEEK